MDEAAVLDILRQGLWTALIVSTPILAVALVVGLAIGLVQALTSVQEMTLTFVPKLAGIAVVLVVAGGWMLAQLTDFTRQLFQAIPGLLGVG